MEKIITVNDDRFEVLGTIPADRDYNPDELKNQWGADNILRNGDTLYMVRKLIEAEFEDIKWYYLLFIIKENIMSEQLYTLEEIFKWLGEKKITSVRDFFESKYDLSTIEESIFSLTSRDREHLLLWIMRRNCAQA